ARGTHSGQMVWPDPTRPSISAIAGGFVEPLEQGGGRAHLSEQRPRHRRHRRFSQFGSPPVTKTVLPKFHNLAPEPLCSWSAWSILPLRLFLPPTRADIRGVAPPA